MGAENYSASKPTGNIFIRCFKKIFIKMYPSGAKTLYTSQGIWLRRMAVVFLFLDIIFTVFSLAMVGFLPMIQDLCLACLGYSMYLTIREWVVMLYLLLKLVFGLGLIWQDQSNMSYLEQTNTIMKFGQIANATFHLLSVFFVGKAYYYFRKNGGIWGTRGKERCLREGLIEKAGVFVTNVAHRTEQRLDNETARERADNKHQQQLRKL